MKVLKLNEYIEYIDVEFKGVSPLSVKAIRTDHKNNSLKSKLDLNCLKSCDYIKFKGFKTLTLIECSDLDRQKRYLDNSLENLILQCDKEQSGELKKCASVVKKQYKKIATNVIVEELKTKYKDSLLLVNKITDKCDINFTQRFDKRNFYIVTNKLEVSSKDASIAKDKLKKDLERELKDSMYFIVDSVKVFSPEKLQKELSLF